LLTVWLLTRCVCALWPLDFRFANPASITTTLLQAMAVLREAVAPMLAWLQRWRRPAADPADAEAAVEVPRSGGCRAAVAVAGVEDIEESIWAPRYGLKGMIDASVALRLAPLHGARQVYDFYSKN